MAAERGSGLRLRVEDDDDLAVLSACLQDALVAVRDLGFLVAEQSFIFVVNRFRWEGVPASSPATADRQRVLCAVTFSAVIGVSYRGFRRTEADRILCLLAIRNIANGGRGAVVLLEFAGAATIRLEVSRLCARAQDLGEPWPTPWQPRHDEDDQE
jgi:hypothetical protein